MERLALHMPLTDRVYREILDAICDGELAPGQRLTQDELAERLNKLAPISAALKSAFFTTGAEATENAIKIARDWNVPASGSGFVTRFEVRKDFLDRYQVQTAGGRASQEYWIPAEELSDFNAAIAGEIEVTSLRGSVREACLWSTGLAGPGVTRRASLLDPIEALRYE